MDSLYFAVLANSKDPFTALRDVQQSQLSDWMSGRSHISPHWWAGVCAVGVEPSRGTAPAIGIHFAVLGCGIPVRAKCFWTLITNAH